MQIETIIRYHLIPVKMVIIKRQEIANTGKDIWKKEHLCSIAGDADWLSHDGKQYGDS